MAKLAYYPRYPHDYLSDTEHLTLEQHGAYSLLIDHLWQAGQRTGVCAILDDPARIAHTLRCSPAQWKKIRKVLVDDSEHPVLHESGGYLAQKRVSKEFEKAKARAESAAESAGRRWRNDAKADANALRTHCEPICVGNASAIAAHRSSLIGEVVEIREEVGLLEGSLNPHTPEKSPCSTAACVEKGPTYSLEFERFWEVYPRQIAKVSAWKAWHTIRGRPPLDRLLSAVSSARQSSSWKRENGRYVPSPAKWLTERRWDDSENKNRSAEQELVEDCPDLAAHLARRKETSLATV